MDVIAKLEVDKAILQSDKQQAQDLNSLYVQKKKEFEVDLSAKDALITKLQAERVYRKDSVRFYD